MRVRRVVALVVVTASAVPVSAHLGHVVLRAERYLKIDARADAVRVVVSLTLGPAETERVMRAADTDGDAEVTQTEADAYMAQWGEGLQDELPVWIDGERVRPPWGQPFLDPIGPVVRAAGAVEMVARIPLDGGEHTIRVDDRMQVERYDRTDVVFRAEEAELVVAGRGEAPEGLEERFFFGHNADAPSTLSAVVRLPGWSDEERYGAIGAAFGALLLVVLSWLGLRRRERRA